MSENRIFVNYRRDDTAAVADSIYVRLREHFGDVVFKDVDHMPAGVTFRSHLESVAETVDAMVVLVGDHWLDTPSGQDKPRLWSSDDTLRNEIEVALSGTCLMIPIHVRGAAIPARKQLPKSIKQLSEFTWYEFDPKQPARDLAPIIAKIEDVVPAKDSAEPVATPWSTASRHSLPASFGRADIDLEEVERRRRRARAAALRPTEIGAWRWGLPLSVLIVASFIAAGEGLLRGAMAMSDRAPTMPASVWLYAGVTSLLVGAAAWAIATVMYVDSPGVELEGHEFVVVSVVTGPAVLVAWVTGRAAGEILARNYMWDRVRWVVLLSGSVTVVVVAGALAAVVAYGPILRSIGNEATDDDPREPAVGEIAIGSSICLAAGLSFPFAAETCYSLLTGAMNRDPVDVGHLATWMVLSGLLTAVGGAVAGMEVAEAEPLPLPGGAAAGAIVVGVVSMALWFAVRGVTHALTVNIGWLATPSFHLIWWIALLGALVWTVVVATDYA